MKTIIEVIMLSYNNGDTIERAIKSVLEQKVNDDTVVFLSIYDNASTDNTQEIISRYGNAQINDRNIGYVDNFIQSLELATGDYIAFLDADDYWICENKLQKQLDAFDEDTEIVYTSGIDKRWKSEKKREVGKHSIKDLIRNNQIMWQTVMIKPRKTSLPLMLCDLYRLRNENMFCDYVSIMALAYKKIKALSDITTIHTIEGNSVSQPFDRKKIFLINWQILKERIYYCKRYGLGAGCVILSILRTAKRCITHFVKVVWG
jgi:glycosyltransferase involved in cell wall biosynthesis